MRGVRGRGKGTFLKVPFPLPRFSLRYAPRAAKLTLKGAGELIRTGRGLAAALDPFKPGK